MTAPYLCPNCKTNRTRFNIMEQHPQAVKLDPKTGSLVSQYDSDEAGPFHAAYTGTDKRVQCGACGLVEDEFPFLKFAKSHPLV
ncbi:DNA alkylation repair protein [Metabacillus sp. RGM 3146]|uniref:DNA alkylation repair protein n=1 Tax=Metabacillus sp. RGM 3146 TaxID=3401092 RepID=UPI003B99F0D7